MSLQSLLGRPIAFHRAYTEITGCVTGALFLSQAVYWQQVVGDGWWWKTMEDWAKETGMVRKELETARASCSSVIEWERRGVPAKTFYRVDLAKIVTFFTNNQDGPKVTNWTVTKLPTGPLLSNELLGKTTSENTSKTTNTHTADAVSEAAALIYETYPRKTARPKALKCIQKCISRHGFEHVLSKTQEFSKLWANVKDKRFCPHPTTWFNQERYNDPTEEWNRPEVKALIGEQKEIQEHLPCKEIKLD